MNNEQELKNITKESIFQALMILMKKKDYQEITVTEITKKAGVSRMAYYRNYESKEDILTTYLDDLFQDYINTISKNMGPDMSEVYIGFFEYFRAQEDFLKMIIKAKLNSLLLEKFDEYMNFVLNLIFLQVEPSAVNKYELHYAAGGIYKVLMEWIRGGMKESDKEMASIIQHLAVYPDIKMNPS
ncbi:MAG: TetR/AcrR family transcriptional regulator [Oscillospiraceae bacterium]|nr:TetR/AcrR family transcriptional regulator [Oscillospiraceae bacterium]